MRNFYRILFIGFANLAIGFCARCQLLSDGDPVISKLAPQHAGESEQVPGVLVSVGDIAVNGYKKTKLYIIEREIPFKKGDVLLLSELKAKMQLARQQLMNTSLFVDVDVKIIDRKGDEVFINVYVKERWYLFPLPYFQLVDRNFNEWWVHNKRSLQRINYGIKFTQNNVSGRNDNLSILLIGGYTQEVSMRYESPFMDAKLKNGINVGFSYSRNREINYSTNNIGEQLFYKDSVNSSFLIKRLHFDAAYTYRPAIKTRHSFRVGYTKATISDSVISKNPDYYPRGERSISFPDLTYTVRYFDVDYIPYPLRGFKGEASLSKRFGKDNNMWEVSFTGTYNKQIFPKSYIELQAAGVARAPFRQPYFTSRIFGSSNMYMRGLEYYVIDGAVGGVARATAKKEVLNFSIRNPIPIKTLEKLPFRVFLKAFTDVGYTYTPNEFSRLQNRWLKTWGVGIDIISIYDLVLRVEYSFNQFGESGLFFHTKSDF